MLTMIFLLLIVVIVLQIMILTRLPRRDYTREMVNRALEQDRIHNERSSPPQ